MVICTAEQIRAWDAYTIKHEPIASINLMERAARKCFEWITMHPFKHQRFKIFCGKGNNGGDGLAIARMLYQQQMDVEVYIPEFGKPGTPDFQTNLQRLQQLKIPIHFIQSKEFFPTFHQEDIIVDALFGSGLNKPVDGLNKELIEYLNEAKRKIIAIDLPSGLFCDRSSKGCTTIKANHTLSFQCYKTAFVMAENEEAIGTVHILDIGLHPGYLEQADLQKRMIDQQLVQSIFKPRKPHSHKGTYGHAMLIGGSYGKIGAIVLATSACLRSGAGLTTAYIPDCGYHIVQMSQPEAMVQTDRASFSLENVPSHLEKYNVIGIGPGLGTETTTQQMLLRLIKKYNKPLVIDADALNCLALNRDYVPLVPPLSILTPHPKEFERLFGECHNDFDRMDLAIQKAKELNIVIVLKGHHTLVALPEGRAYFNFTGNAGMAKGGSGDVLTGIITALCAQGYEPGLAALFGVYLHGLAGDLAAAVISKEAMVARDIIRFLSQAFLTVEGKQHKQ